MNQLKEQLCKVIDDHRDEIIALGEDIFAHPELGYKETRTSEIIFKKMQELGIADITCTAKTGVKGWLKGNDNKASVAVIGELDAVVSPLHPHANPASSAAHACGHHAQLAGMIGAIVGLSAIKDSLDGNVCFMAAPAEEYIEIGFRSSLREKGEISYLGGKQQMIAEGAFDDIDIAMMVHSETDRDDAHIVINGSAIGFIGKTIAFEGKEAHAGGAPWLGINALNAATLAIQAIHAQRETFRDVDCVRVHPIITKGGDLVNTVPADVRMESYVRAASIPAMQEANEKVNRAIKGASYAIGATAHITDIPGYLPLNHNEVVSDLFADNAILAYPNANVENGLSFSGSTDMGDLSWVLPVIQPTISGFNGALHSKDFVVTDPELAYIAPAKIMAMTVVDLLCNNAEKAISVRDSFDKKSVQQYKELWDDILK